ncbi:hypothetical protein JTE88_02090 [Arcanobacterium phocisimile]|uniref:Uncharacterized protein n=1 Tax=Arcanobacterium phocisimile TaxID=1302235 RepID=A0ABX7IIL3_9ACTO|nr:hypothetical protein [Arcanobacterium phocisimile]QRV02565.1 hypothetical protein JTE88_02090 [Arcanobacterium phocisimile]
MGAHVSDVAVESADISCAGQELTILPQLFAHGRRCRRIIDQNIGFSLLIVLGLLPLALTGVLGLAMVVFVHEFGEVLVILNGLRAGRFPRGAVSR